MNAWGDILAVLERKRRFSRSGGGEARLIKHRAQGKLNARERARALFDDGRWVEIGGLAANMSENGEHPAPADGIVAGLGEVFGQPCLTLIEDFTVLAGSIGDAGAAKRARVVQLALQEKVPLVFMIEGAGHRLTNVHATPAPNDLQLLADCHGRIPLVTLVLGASAGHSALAAPLADFVVMTEAASLFVAGPPIVKGAIGEDVTKEQLGGPDVHVRQSGVVHNLTLGDSEAVGLARRYLSFVSPCNLEGLDSLKAIEGEAILGEILDVVDPNPARAYPMRSVVSLLADRDSMLELQPEWGASLIAALIRLGGVPAMVLANDPSVRAGTIDAQAAQKAVHFLRVAEYSKLPVVFLADNPGVMPGTAAERAGTLRYAAAMFAEQRRLSVPKIHVTLRKAFGFGSSVMAMNPFDRQTTSLAFPAVTLGAVPVGSGGSAAGLSESERANAATAQTQASWNLAGKLAFDDIIDPRDLRKAIRRSLLLARQR
ncbi:MAG: carboxyl transferase domain-containing protein [Sphingomonadaceae bacterium]